jgi:hypothetical protein
MTYLRTPWKAAFLMSVFFIAGNLVSCSSDDVEVEPDPDKDPDTENPEGTLDPLLTARIPDDVYQLRENGHGIIFASDDQGNVLSAKEFYNGDDISLKPDELFAGKTFMLTVFYVRKDASNDKNYSMEAYTYTDVPRGVKWNELGQFLPATEPTTEGSITVTVKKSSGWNADYLRLSTDYTYATTDFSSGSTWNREVPFGTSKSLIAWDEAADDSRFAVYENLSPGQTLQIKTDDLTQVMKKEQVPVPENTRSLSIQLYGIPDRDKNTRNYYVGGTYAFDDYMVRFPDIDLFETFDGVTFLETDDYTLNSFHYNAKYGVTPIDHRFSMVAGQADPQAFFSANANAMDFVKLEWSYGEQGPTPYGDGEWEVFTAPGEDRKIILPLLPSLVTDLVGNADLREQFTRNRVTFGAFDALDGYAEWMALGTGTGSGTMNAYRLNKDSKEMIVSLKPD